MIYNIHILYLLTPMNKFTRNALHMCIFHAISPIRRDLNKMQLTIWFCSTISRFFYSDYFGTFFDLNENTSDVVVGAV